MTDEWIRLNAIQTAIYLPIVCVTATIVCGVCAHILRDYEQPRRAFVFCLKATLFSLAVSWTIILLNIF